jgi:hypothetical protein
METKTKPFDAVAESRKWREATSRKLNALSLEERLEYLRQVRERYAQEYAAHHPESGHATASSS